MNKKVGTHALSLSRRDFLRLSGLAAGSALLKAACQAPPILTPTLTPAASPAASPAATSTAAPLSRATATATPIAANISPAATLSPTVVAPTPTAVVAPPRNIIWIGVDAVRADHVSSYGYARPTTPNLDAWMGRQGVRFQKATTVTPWTFPASAAMMTGRTPSAYGLDWDHTTLPNKARTLAEYLRAAGYYTVGVVAAPFVRAKNGFSQGFDIYEDRLTYSRPTSYRGQANELNNLTLNWLAGSSVPGKRPLFLYLYYFDPHTWYNPMPPYDTLYDPDYTGPVTAKVYADGRDTTEGKVTLTARDVEHLLALYDGEITYWDYYLGQILTALDKRKLLDQALVIVTSDHGDMFGEHHLWTHGNCLYEELLHVPLLMRFPGVIQPGLVVETPVQNMDVMPTILDWAGVKAQEKLHSVSLRALAQGAGDVAARDVFSELPGVTDPKNWAYWLAPRDHLFSVRRGPWKLIHHANAPQADELYQLNAASPYETENLISSQADLAGKLRQAVREHFGL